MSDLISRKALKEAVGTWDKFGYTAQGELIRLTEENKDLYVPYVKYQDMVNCIDNAPTITPDMAQVLAYECGKNERLKGEWIITSEDTEGIHHIKCPFCKYEKGSEFEPYIKVTFDKLPCFCEKCGADMREEKRDEQTTD